MIFRKGKRVKVRRGSPAEFYELTERSWNEFSKSRDGAKVLESFNSEVMSSSNPILLEPAMGFLLVRLSEATGAGLYYLPAEEKREYVSAETTVQAIVAGAIGRLHALDPEVDLLWIENFLKEALGSSGDIATVEFENGGDRTFSALVLALSFGYLGGDKIWSDVDSVMSRKDWRMWMDSELASASFRKSKTRS